MFYFNHSDTKLMLPLLIKIIIHIKQMFLPQ